MLDLVVINPGASHGIYGELGSSLVAKEPPLWARIIAAYVRDRGFKVKIIDAEAEDLSPEAAAERAVHMSPRLVCICVFGHQPSSSTQQMVGASATARAIKARKPGATIIMVGGHVAALPERTLREEAIDYACNGEGPVTIVRMLKDLRNPKPWIGQTIEVSTVPGLVYRDGRNKIVQNPRAPFPEMKDLHGNAWDLLPMHAYRAHNWQCFGDLSKRQPYASITTTFNCPYKCLAGDTLVDTMYGQFAIKDLAEKYGESGIPVYTYDPQNRRAFIADAIAIRKYGANEKLVRVHFDDGSHIDCTPDHKFLQFKSTRGRGPGNNLIQWETEAQNLRPGSRLRALRFEDQLAYTYVCWERRKSRLRSRMVMEYLIGRDLLSTEHVHHRDHNKKNDHPSNLHLYASAADHFADHPEVSERMRTNNPTKEGMSEEWIANLAAANRGKVRSLESRLRYRASKLGKKNPNYKHGLDFNRSSRVVGVNHRVVWIEALDKLGDVYCLTVPETGWFFANNVLVKNCSFCCISSPFGDNRYRMRDPQDVIDEIRFLWDEHEVKTFKIVDEMFVLNPRHYLQICDDIAAAIEYGSLPHDLNIWAYARVDSVKPDVLPRLKAAGIRWLALGIESGSAHVRDGASKALRNDDIIGVVRAIQAAGINVIGNFIFGLRDDTAETMQQTLDLALVSRCEFSNFYSAMAYPGSRLYDQAVAEGWTLPETWAGYSQHNEWCRPLDTEHVSAREVLAFRDKAFDAYFTDPAYLDMVERKFGKATLEHVRGMVKYRLKRKLLTGEIQ